MSSQLPPNPWFNTINYNQTFFPSSSASTGITLSYANSNYLRISAGSNPVSNATTTTFSGQLIATNDVNSVISISNKVLMTPVASGIIYLVGVSSAVGGNYNLITDSLSHLVFATGTNTLQVGISGGANGNMNLYGTGAILSIPTSTSATAISVPSGTISSLNLTASGLATLTGGIALPTNGTATTSAQLGYTYFMTTTGGSFVSGTTKAIGNIPAGTIPSGTYQVNYSYGYAMNWSVIGSLTQFTIDANIVSATTMGGTYGTNNIFQFGGVFGGQAIGVTYNGGASHSGILIIPNASTTIFFNALATWTGTATLVNIPGATGYFSLTRIA